MKIDTITMFTSEIAVVELNTLRDEITLVIPEDLEVQLVTHHSDKTFIQIVRKNGG